MEACLSHEAALRWLLGNPNPLATGRGHACAEAPPSQAPTVAQARELARLTGLESLDVLVSSKAATRKTALLRTHLDARSLPAGSLIRVGGFSLCSPELVFLQMAATHDLIDTIRCGYALCSRYRLDNGARGGAAVRKAPDAPLTSRDRLERYLEASTGAKGVVRARRALRHVLDNSFSPMESGIAMCLSMPLNLGGHALGEVCLNPELKVRTGTDADGRRLYETRRPDLLVSHRAGNGTQRRVAIDVDATSTHATTRDLAHDAARRNELQSSLDMPHLTITGRQATDYVAFSRFVDLVRLALGQRRKDFSRGGGERDRTRLENVRRRQFELWLRCVSAASRAMGR